MGFLIAFAIFFVVGRLIARILRSMSGSDNSVAVQEYDEPSVSRPKSEQVNSGSDIYDHYKRKYQNMEKEGKVIDWYLVNTKSKEKGYPYPPATEAEERELETEGFRMAIKGDVYSIAGLMKFYQTGLSEDTNTTEATIHKDNEKLEYWKNVLKTRAQSGDKVAQGGLISSFAKACLTDNEFNNNETLYKDSLINAAANGDPQAMYSVALFRLSNEMNDFVSIMKYFLIAGSQGIADAYYHAVSVYKAFKPNGFDYGWNSADNKYIYSLYQEGAKYDNGVYS